MTLTRPRGKRLAAVLVLLLAGGPLAGAEPPYQERYRPRFHFTPERNWMNDPNGLVFHDGEFHLFYQYNPSGDRWGHMSWGHAVSEDLVHWRHLPVAIPEADGIMAFSGSAVADHRNSSGLGRDGRPPLVAIYTGRRNSDNQQSQWIASSTDRGRTWTIYPGNPVLDIGSKDFRDPKVFWHEPAREWVMVVAMAAERKVRFYGSPDLLRWTLRGELGPAGSVRGIWECPDLFPLPVEGETGGRERWVLIVNVGSGAPAGGSGGQYFIGDFDGRKFTQDAGATPEEESKDTEPAGTMLADFEGTDYGDWKPAGEAFGKAPACGALPDQQTVTGFRGAGLVNTYLGGDASQGTLTSPAFEIASPYINFLIGGGSHAGSTCVNLLVEGKVERTATGADDEKLDWHAWDVRDLKGRRAQIEIADRHTGRWGHINTDHIVLAGAPARSAGDGALWLDHGADFYAAVTWSDVPATDGRRILLGWMSNWEYAQDAPTSPWRSAMSLPRELGLRATPAGIRLVARPVRELERLRGEHIAIRDRDVTGSVRFLEGSAIRGDLLEVIAEIEPRGASSFGLEVREGAGEETVIRVQGSGDAISVDRRRSGRADFHSRFAGVASAPCRLRAGAVKLHVLVDASSVEVFANDGEAVLTATIFPSPESTGASLFAEGGAVRVRSLDAWALRSIWPRP